MEPCQYQLKGIVHPSDEKKGLNVFAQGLVRAEPDKVGEMPRDMRRTHHCNRHLVLSTVHANNAFDNATFVDMGIKQYNFVASLNCIMAQRLVRRLCESCKVTSLRESEHCQHLGFNRSCSPIVRCTRARAVLDAQRAGISRTPCDYQVSAYARLPNGPKAPPREGMSTLRQAGDARVVAGDSTMKKSEPLQPSSGNAMSLFFQLAVGRRADFQRRGLALVGDSDGAGTSQGWSLSRPLAPEPAGIVHHRSDVKDRDS